MTTCPVCRTRSATRIYRSSEPHSLTSLCEFRDGFTEVHFCGCCGHLTTTPILDVTAYYATQYNIFTNSVEEDSLYRIESGRPVYRVEHQVRTILQQIDLPQHARVLDYGCGKSGTSRRLLQERPDLQVHLFDVSEAYLDFWRDFVSPARWAVHAPKPEWIGSFDAVFSFFALEHVIDPHAFIADMARLVKPSGHVHILVPNVYSNPADLVVVDHVNHFSDLSLKWLLTEAGLYPISIDADAHDGALVATAQKRQTDRLPYPPDATIRPLAARAHEMGMFWSGVADRVRRFEAEHSRQRAVVYGSGFYGTFIASCLANPSLIECFLDSNPHRHGKTLMQKNIVAAQQIPDGIEVVYVGLNPALARDAIAKVPILHPPSRHFFYL